MNKSTSITLVSTNDPIREVTAFPVFDENTHTEVRGYRWNRSRRDFQKSQETIQVLDGDTLYINDGLWLHVKYTERGLRCFDVTDGMIGVDPRGPIVRTARRIQHCVMRLELYPNQSIRDYTIDMDEYQGAHA